MRVAVSGADGRLGAALLDAFGGAWYVPTGPIAWRRPEFDLDRPDEFAALLELDRPEVVVHAAAWTDVDGCAREPDLARARNGDAAGELARSCAALGVDLVLVSTNEVFDGRRTDGCGYRADDEVGPINAYGASKLDGERQATAAFTAPVGGEPAGTGDGAALAIVRTAWLFGPGKPDFPTKILAAAERARDAGEPLRAVSDEIGGPSYAADVAEAIVELVGSGGAAGVHHVVNGGAVSRADWARDVLARAGVDVAVEDVPASTWARASTPPAWGVLQPTPLPGGEALRGWRDAMAEYAPILLRGRR